LFGEQIDLSLVIVTILSTSNQGLSLVKNIVLIFAALGIALSAVETTTAAINLRQLDQQRLIDAGHRSGKLTGQERNRLKAQQRAISARERAMRARHNGHLTARDKRLLHALQRQAGRNIEIQKYDGERGRNKLRL
jgi:hypothetical protein